MHTPLSGISQYQSQYPDIVTELLLALKGSRSSIEISKAMGYKYNQVKRWETGEKQLRWDEFCLLCSTIEIPIYDALIGTFQYYQPDPRGFLNHLYSNKYPLLSIEELSKLLHRHPSAIRRYVDGEIFPDLEFVLAFMDLDVNRLGSFILSLLPPGEGASLRARFTDELDRMKIEAMNPLAAAVQGWLMSHEYLALNSHDSSYIAMRVGSTNEEVGEILEKMTQRGAVIRLENGKFAPNHHKIEMSGIDLQLLVQFFKFWTDRAANHYAQEPFVHKGTVHGVGACRVIPVSRRLSQEINQIVLRADAQIRSLLDKAPQDEPIDDVRVILMKTFSSRDF
jgi:hypothetical protein